MEWQDAEVHLQMTVQQQWKHSRRGSGCGRNRENDASGNAEGGSQEGTLTVWCWDSFNVDAMKEAGKLYQKDHPDVNINVVETVSSDIQTLVQTYAMSGELDALPDIFLMDDQVFAKYLQNYPDVFADLTDSGIAFADFAEAKVANSVKDGKIMVFHMTAILSLPAIEKIT